MAEETNKQAHERLLIAAQVSLRQQSDAPVELQRGMTFVSREGQTVGHLAAIVVRGDPPEARALLLDQLPTYLDYRVVSLEQVSHVTGEAITLLLDAHTVARLPHWRQPVGL